MSPNVSSLIRYADSLTLGMSPSVSSLIFSKPLRKHTFWLCGMYKYVTTSSRWMRLSDFWIPDALQLCTLSVLIDVFDSRVTDASFGQNVIWRTKCESWCLWWAYVLNFMTWIQLNDFPIKLRNKFEYKVHFSSKSIN